MTFFQEYSVNFRGFEAKWLVRMLSKNYSPIHNLEELAMSPISLSLARPSSVSEFDPSCGATDGQADDPAYANPASGRRLG